MERSKRQRVVLLFTDLSASTQLAAKIEPEQYGEILEGIRLCIQRVVERHGGEIIRVDGDGVLCLFGYPITYEDVVRRAVDAALEAHSAIGNLETAKRLARSALKLHSGIHAGPVLLRQGDIVRGRYEVLGDATNVAARICDAANAGEILVSLTTLGRDRRRFEGKPMRRIPVAGHRNSFEALPVTRSRQRKPDRAKTIDICSRPMIGRERERSAFLDWLNKSQTVPFLMVHGPPGIGKSRLLGQLIEDSKNAGWKSAIGSCDPYLGTRALQPFVEIVQSLASSDEHHDTPEESFIRQVIDDCRESRNLLLLIDDWQWADEKSRLFLLSLADTVAAAGAKGKLKLLVASRLAWPTDEELQPAQSLLLEPLAGSDLEEAINALLPSCDNVTAGTIERASGGTPLLLEEVCHAVAAGRAIDATSVRSTWYELAVQARVEALSREDAKLLQLCATIGPIIPIWLLAEAHGAAIDHSQLIRLSEADFLRNNDKGDWLEFKHGMTRDAVYFGIGLVRRTELHRRLADILKSKAALQPGLHDEDLALHLLASQQIEDALPYAVAAGDRALSAGSLDRAQFHYREAYLGLERLDNSTDHTKTLRHIIKSFGRATVVDPMRHHVEFFERLLRFANSIGDVHSIALATYWIGSHYYGLGEPRRSLEVLQSAYELTNALGASTFAVQIQANLGQTNAVAARYPDALRYMDAAIDAKLQNGSRHELSTSLAYCLSSRGLVKADTGDFAGAFVDFDASIEALGDMRNPILPSLETQRCLALIYQGHFEEAYERAEFSERMAEHSHARFLVFSARALGSYARFAHTEDPAYFDRFVEATLRLFTSRRLQRISYKFGWICEEMVERGEEQQARLFAFLAFRRALKGDRLGEASAARGLARLSAKRNDSRSANRYLSMADRAGKIRVSERELALNQLCSGECFAMLGEKDIADQHIARAARSFEQLEMHQFASRLDLASNLSRSAD